MLRVTPTYTNGTWFVQAQAEIVANTDQYNVQPAPGVVAADDVWVRTGELQQWDVTLGRFQAFDVYPLGMGLDLNTYERLGAFDPAFTGSPNGYNAVPALYGADYHALPPLRAQGRGRRAAPLPRCGLCASSSWGSSAATAPRTISARGRPRSSTSAG